MLEAYSLNQTVAANSPIPLNSVVIEKGCDARLVSPSTVNLNRRGVYEISVDASSAASASIGLYRNGVLLADTVRAGTSPSFSRLIQASENNTGCCCSSPVTVQVVNPADAEATYTAVNVVVKKVCGQ